VYEIDGRRKEPLAMVFDPNKPYNELAALPPPIELETKVVLKACIRANQALAELKMAGELIPSQTMLINTIPLQEAQASSEIENIVTTQDQLFRADVSGGKDADPATKEVLRYRTALKNGYEALKKRPLTTNSFKQICQTIFAHEVDIRKVPGTVIKNTQTNEVLYTPPEGKKVILEKLADLERYIHSETDVDVLVRLALFHYQFEAIHPFHDGNGRTGRILNILYLVEKGLLHHPVLYLSRYIIRNKVEYYRCLRAVTEKAEWEPWVLYIINAVDETARWTTLKIHEIRDAFKKTCEECKSKLPSAIYSKDLIETLYLQPYCRIETLTHAKLAKRQTASKYLQALQKIGVLNSVKVGREKLYLNKALMKILYK
jgi:Fic family protein